MDPNLELQTQANPFRDVIVLLNAAIPIVCVVGILAGVLLIAAKNRWGYYIVGISLVGLIARMFISG